MDFWIFMTLFVLLIPSMMLLFGLIFKKNSPKEINSLFGYRTAMSMKNRDTWDFAHRHIGKLWVWVAIIIAPLSILPMLLVLGKGDDTVGTVGTAIMLIQLIPLIVPIFFTEAALKKAFDKDGSRR